MNKMELATLLDSLGIQVNEGIQNDGSTKVYPRIVYWEYVWEPLTASGTEYDTNVTYQISFFSKIPREPKLLELRNELKKINLFPIIQHEYIQEDKLFHSYFALEVLENV